MGPARQVLLLLGILLIYTGMVRADLDQAKKALIEACRTKDRHLIQQRLESYRQEVEKELQRLVDEECYQWYRVSAVEETLVQVTSTMKGLAKTSGPIIEALQEKLRVTAFEMALELAKGVLESDFTSKVQELPRPEDGETAEAYLVRVSPLVQQLYSPVEQYHEDIKGLVNLSGLLSASHHQGDNPLGALVKRFDSTELLSRRTSVIEARAVLSSALDTAHPLGVSIKAERQTLIREYGGVPRTWKRGDLLALFVQLRRMHTLCEYLGYILDRLRGENPKVHQVLTRSASGKGDVPSVANNASSSGSAVRLQRTGVAGWQTEGPSNRPWSVAVTILLAASVVIVGSIALAWCLSMRSRSIS